MNGQRPAAPEQTAVDPAAVREAAVEPDRAAQVDPAARAARMVRVVIEGLGVKRRKAAAVVRRFTRTFFVPVEHFSRLLSSSVLAGLQWFPAADTS